MNRRRVRRLHAVIFLACVSIRCPAHAKPDSKHSGLIQIGVEVVEVDEDKTEKLGIQWPGHWRISETAVPAVLEVGTLTRNQLFADVDMLLTEGAADLLANPKLVTRDGATAHFHAGGEIPYIVSSGMGAVSVEFKLYGIELRIHPHLEESGKIALDIEAHVSSLDEKNGVSLSGNQVPGLLDRRVKSQLTLNPGTTLTLAGLIQNQKQSQIHRIPVLSKIPLLGLLFRHKVITNRRTSIVVFVTPTLLGEQQNATL